MVARAIRRNARPRGALAERRLRPQRRRARSPRHRPQGPTAGQLVSCHQYNGGRAVTPCPSLAVLPEHTLADDDLLLGSTDSLPALAVERQSARVAGLSAGLPLAVQSVKEHSRLQGREHDNVAAQEGRHLGPLQ